ncbi:integral membrane protein TIGR01906 [Arthrobacter subterraneus]|uniref:Integral membrane protein TIGR01906 n=1 Tax=Arthrobacter subterraneus TaxID=335973 RepID=A0A1G8J7X3_9MICC|nr:DUF1461 domain-containing protein [Arthrobacter subterraneus]SDI27286.1 integral membrane protein TIGR01906 [Arthrobacter subterraneus]
MADKAENENQGVPAGGERRAALRSDDTGVRPTRMRESSFPMRKASTLPDVSAYSSPGGSTSAEEAPGETTPEANSSPAAPTSWRSSNPSDAAGRNPQEPLDDGAPTASGDPTRNDDDATVTSPDADNPASTRVDQPADRPEPAGTRADTGPTDHVTTDPQPATSHIAATTAGASTTADPTSPATSQIAATPDNDELAGTSAPDEAPSRGNGIGTETGTGAGTGAAAAAGIAAGATASAATKAKATRNRTTPADDPNPDTSSLSIRPPEEDVSRRANQRDEAAAAKPVLPRVLQVMVAVFFPVILLAAAVRAVTTPLFLWVEYHRPGFPADSYGFSTEDRMTYGSYTMDYILNWAPARYLGDLVNVDGDQLFLDSEVGHMADVKGVLATGFVVATVLALLAVAACIYLARKYPGGIRRALFAGATATLVLAIALAVAGILAWETFFTQVHALFFADGTWTFRLDDTLIRLFPAQFWIDAAAAVGAIVLIGSVLTLVLTWPTKARREKSARAYEARRANSGV